MKKIERLLKYTSGGIIDQGDNILRPGTRDENGNVWDGKRWLDPETQKSVKENLLSGILNPIQTQLGFKQPSMIQPGTSALKWNDETKRVDGKVNIVEKAQTAPEDTSVIEEEGLNNITEETKLGDTGGSSNVPWGMIGNAAIATTNAIDDAVMGDKNFSASSQAVDSAVDVAASTASQFGPWGLLAAGILKTVNFASKAGGKNVQGFDVDINNSGYGNLGHKDSEAGRDWGAFLGLPGVFPQRGMERKLRKRNEEANMALTAANISQDLAYEQEARANSVSNILQLNQIALAGGIDTSLLGN